MKLDIWLFSSWEVERKYDRNNEAAGASHCTKLEHAHATRELKSGRNCLKIITVKLLTKTEFSAVHSELEDFTKKEVRRLYFILWLCTKPISLQIHV